MIKRKPSKNPQQKLIRKLDSVFSTYIRMRDADSNGFIRCCTCGRIAFWKESDCGHYHGRQYMSTRWDESNCHAQCRQCNRFNEGEKAAYKEFLIKKYGQEAADLLEVKRRLTRRWHRFELEAMIVLYKEELKKIEAKPMQD